MNPSDRTQVLDAVIEYPGDRVVVIENKVADAPDEQARSITIAGTGVQIVEGQQRQAVLWRDLLADPTRVLEHSLVGGAEPSILADFLDYADNHFPQLGPYQTIGLCKGDEFRIVRRLRVLLSQASGHEAHNDEGSVCVELPELESVNWVGSRAYLRHRKDREVVELSVYLADTLTLARVFYPRPKRIATVLALMAEPDWIAEPNFHFGDRWGREHVFCWGEIETERYLDLWQDRIGQTGRLDQTDWQTFWEWLVNEQIAGPEDREEFDRVFETRSTADPKPGLHVCRRWDMKDAVRLDGKGKLGQISEALTAVLGALAA